MLSEPTGSPPLTWCYRVPGKETHAHASPPPPTPNASSRLSIPLWDDSCFLRHVHLRWQSRDFSVRQNDWDEQHAPVCHRSLKAIATMICWRAVVHMPIFLPTASAPSSKHPRLHRHRCPPALGRQSGELSHPKAYTSTLPCDRHPEVPRQRRTWKQAPANARPVPICRRAMLESVQQQPPDNDRYVRTSYGVAARRVDQGPPAGDQDAAMFGGPSLQPVTYTSAPSAPRCPGPACPAPPLAARPIWALCSASCDEIQSGSRLLLPVAGSTCQRCQISNPPTQGP